MSYIAAIISFLLGAGTTAAAVYRYFASRITPEDAGRIYQDARKTIDDYRDAIAKGPLTPDEKVAIAEDAIATLEEVIKDLCVPKSAGKKKICEPDTKEVEKEPSSTGAKKPLEGQ